MSSPSTETKFPKHLAVLQDPEPINVLHVDDEPDFTDLASIHLERESDDIAVITADSVEAGLERLETDAIDCVVSDYDMPHRNGLDFLAIVQEEYPEIPFILYTGKGSEEIASEAITAGVTDYLQKKSGTDQYTVLAHRIQNAARQYKTKREIERMGIALQTVDAGIAFLNEDGQFIYVNPEYGEVLGYAPEELTGQPIDMLYPDELVNQVYEDILPTVPQEGEWTGESIHIHKDGTRLLVSQRFSYCSAGMLLCFILNVTKQNGTNRQFEGMERTDISERKAREQKPELVETLFEHAEECQFIVEVADGEFELRHANDYYKRTVGLPSGEPVTSQTPTELFGEAGGEEILDRYDECVESRESVTYTVEVPIPEEGTVYRTILTPVVTDDKVTHIVGTARDITDHRRREEEMNRQNNRLEEFATVVSHDLRNPLRVADGRLALIQEECESDHIAEVSQALDRMETLIDDLLTLANAGESVGEPEGVELAELADACWQNVETDTVTLRVDTTLTIQADKTRLQQLLENLLRNAVEHGGEDITVTIGELPDGFYVEDNGPGIPSGERTNVLEPGYSTREDGTGFGLSIVRDIAEAHDWQIEVTEGSDGGARFEFRGVEIE